MVYIALLVAAAIVVAAAEWGRFGHRLGMVDASRKARARQKRKTKLRVIVNEAPADDRDEFAASVKRDLERLPTIDDPRG